MVMRPSFSHPQKRGFESGFGFTPKGTIVATNTWPPPTHSDHRLNLSCQTSFLRETRMVSMGGHMRRISRRRGVQAASTILPAPRSPGAVVSPAERARYEEGFPAPDRERNTS